MRGTIGKKFRDDFLTSVCTSSSPRLTLPVYVIDYSGEAID